MTKKKDLPLDAGQALEIKAGNFAVEVRAQREGATGAWVEFPASEAPDAPDAVEVTTQGGRVLVTALPGLVSGERTLRVQVAAGEREISVDSGNGRVLLEGLAGRIRAHATNGRVDLKGVQGEIAVVCANGSVDASDIKGTVDLSTANGKIVVKSAALRSGSFKSGNGRVAVQVKPDGPGNLGIFAGNGRVELAVPQDAGFRIRVRTTGRLHNHLESYSVSSDTEATVVERGNGELAVMIQAFKGVRLVKYEDFGKEWDEPGPIPGLGGEDMQDLFDRLGACFGDMGKRFDFTEELPRVASRMQAFGQRFGRMGEEFSRRFQEAQPGGREREVDMILELLKDGKISAEEAERLINAVRAK
jgi:hypothetical protein